MSFENSYTALSLSLSLSLSVFLSVSLCLCLSTKSAIKQTFRVYSYAHNIILFLSSSSQPDKVLERAWSVMHAKTPKGPMMNFYQDNRKENRVLKRDKVDLLSTRELTKLFGHPKHGHCFTLKMKGKRNRFLFDCDSKSVKLCLTQYNSVYYLQQRSPRLAEGLE